MDDKVFITNDEESEDDFKPIPVYLPDNVDSREAKLRKYFTRSSKIIEIGASHAPIVPKSDGWNTIVVDHATRNELIKKYANETKLIDRVEEVDYVWQDGDIADVIPVDLHGTFDGIIASHVGEHMPDILRFLQAADKLLAKDGIISLALPDKRYCFDFFQPHTTTGDVLQAYAQKRTRHERKTFFNQAAYYVLGDGQVGWGIGSKPQFKLVNSLSNAIAAFNNTNTSKSEPYVDTHGLYFTPASLSLIIFELRYLGLIPWDIEIERAPGVEFFVCLKRKSFDNSINSEEYRFNLLKEIIKEKQEELDLISEEKIEEIPAEIIAEKIEEKLEMKIAENSEKHLSIAAIIPLYNGGRYIKDAILSVLNQTRPADEIIIIDDGSTDNSPEKVREIIAENPDRNVQIFSQKNSGQSSARNFGVLKSKSDLIAFLDQDDMWYSNHLDVLIKPFLEDDNRRLGWVYSNLDEVNEQGHLVTRSFLSTIGTTHPKDDIFTCIREDLFILPSASLISRSAFEEVGGFDPQLSGYEDDDLFLRLFRAGYHNIYLDQPLSKWRIHPESASYSYRMARSRSIYMRKLVEMFPDDVKRSRYYCRDLIAPRFRPHFMSEYITAVRQNDQLLIDVATSDLRFLIEKGAAQGRALKLMMAITSNPTLVKIAYKARKPFRKAILRRLSR